MEAFSAYDDSTIQVPADTTSANVQLPSSIGHATRIYNSGTSACRIRFGKDNTVAVTKPVAGAKAGSTYASATKGSLLIAPGSIEVISRPVGNHFVAFACDAGSTTLEFTAGLGV